MTFWGRKRNRKAERLANELGECRLELEKTQRQLAVVEAERDSMAAVIARDRARVQAEAAQFAVVRADHERHRQSDQ